MTAASTKDLSAASIKDLTAASIKDLSAASIKDHSAGSGITPQHSRTVFTHITCQFLENLSITANKECSSSTQDLIAYSLG